MNRKLTKVKETAEQLREKLKSEEQPLFWQRLQALYLIASEQVGRRTQIAKILGVHRNSVQAWLKTYEAGGLEALLQLKKAKGKPPKMTGTARRLWRRNWQLKKALAVMAKSERIYWQSIKLS